MMRVMEVGSGRFGQMVAGMEHIPSMGGRNTFGYLWRNIFDLPGGHAGSTMEAKVLIA
jgi:hypothetical protein